MPPDANTGVVTFSTVLLRRSATAELTVEPSAKRTVGVPSTGKSLPMIVSAVAYVGPLAGCSESSAGVTAQTTR
jgi:hypothetical protein